MLGSDELNVAMPFPLLMTDDSKHWDGPPLSAWVPWRPDEVCQRLQGFPHHWYIVGGWAIDLFLGEESRHHGDIEISIARQDFEAIRVHLDAFPIYRVGDGEVYLLDNDLTPPQDKFQNWVEDPVTHEWRLDIFKRPGDSKTWIYRRDESLTMPMDDAVSEVSGMRYLNPEIVLFFKANSTRDKDQVDFEHCLPRMSQRARNWLRTSLLKYHPNHTWIDRLTHDDSD